MSESLSGVYRGKVVNNVDPQEEGRLEVVVASIDTQPRWAMPSLPYAGPGVGFFALPPIDANVWVSFEEGERANPVWTGCFWGTGELPTADARPEIAFLRTPNVDLTIEDSVDDGIMKLTLKLSNGNQIELTDEGITLITASGASVILKEGGIELDGWPLRFSPLGALQQLVQS